MMEKPKFIDRECKHHGMTIYVLEKYRNSYRCKLCRTQATINYRRQVKEKLVEQAGGQCERCGYNRCMRALSFHHIDPLEKNHAISYNRNVIAFDKLRKEISKCQLLCMNCHMEIEDEISKG